MLGYKEYTAPLGAEESNRIRKLARRIASGAPNSEEKAMLEHYRQLQLNSSNTYVWK